MALAVLRGQAGAVKAGAYTASSAEWAWRILDRLVRGSVADTSITVPEGLWMAEVAQRVGPLVAGGADSFLAAATDSAFVAGLGVPGPNAEGYLFPDTYRFVPGTSARAVVRLMVGEFFRRWKDLEARAAERGVSLRDAVILASIVEAEAQVARERPVIAAVYWNRLRQGLPLQSDPTVIYGLGSGARARCIETWRSRRRIIPTCGRGFPPVPSATRGWTRCARCCGRTRSARTCFSWRAATERTCSPRTSRGMCATGAW